MSPSDKCILSILLKEVPKLYKNKVQKILETRNKGILHQCGLSVESDAVVPTAVLPRVPAVLRYYRGDGVTFEKCCGTTAVAVAESMGTEWGWE